MRGRVREATAVVERRERKERREKRERWESKENDKERTSGTVDEWLPRVQ